MSKLNLSDRFINGLKKYNLTMEDVRDNYKYCGGDEGRHLNYFKIVFPNKETPSNADNCVCGQRIIENCYICHKNNNYNTIIVVGNCCIKKFVNSAGRTCEDCGAPHQNRTDNKCNICRLSKCKECGKTIKPKYKLCYKCFVNRGVVNFD